MKILKLSSYCEPEQISSSHLSRDLEDAYIDAGFEIQIYAPIPTRGISEETFHKYKKIKYEEKRDGKVQINRFFMFREKKNPVLRAIRYILIHIVHYFKAIKNRDIDIIVSGSTPPTQGILLSLVSKKLKVPVVYMLQDIFPDSLLHTGLTTENSVVMKIGRFVENYTYKNMDKIIVISKDFKENIISKGVDSSKIEVVYNWINTNNIKPVAREKNILFDKLELSRDLFYVVYAGNLGYAQNIEVILKVAKELSNNKDIRFIFFGKGSQESYYKDMALAMELVNTEFFPLQPYELVSEVYSLGSTSIVSCQKGIGKNAMPSKTWSILSTGIPVVASYDENTDLHEIITKNDIGIFAKSDDVKELKEAILKLYNDNVLRERMGANARKFVVDNMNKTVATNKYIDIINKTMEEYKCSKTKLY